MGFFLTAVNFSTFLVIIIMKVVVVVVVVVVKLLLSFWLCIHTFSTIGIIWFLFSLVIRKKAII